MTQKKIEQKKFNNAIKKLKSEKLLDEKIATKMEVQEAKTPVFYILSKIRKLENLGRSVKRSVNYCKTGISQYFNLHQQPHVKELNSYVKDSTDFIQK